MSQQTLFDQPREAIPVRATDPETSAEAARRHFDSGKGRSNEMIVFRLLAANEGSTYRELHAAQGDRPAITDHVEITRRLNGLEKLGVVRKDPEQARPCRINGNRMQLWFLTELGRSILTNLGRGE